MLRVAARRECEDSAVLVCAPVFRRFQNFN